MGANSKSKPQKNNGKAVGRVENLNHWPPGTSGNPKGRPKGPSIKTIFTKLLEKETKTFDLTEGAERKMTYYELVALKLMKAIMGENVTAIRTAIEIVDGSIGTTNIKLEGHLSTSEVRMTKGELLERLKNLGAKLPKSSKSTRKK